jgi:hypothetical protein
MVQQMRVSPETVILMTVPREIALLSGSDYKDGKIAMTLFANERRLGPVFAKFINTSPVFEKVKLIQWDEQHAFLPERGKLLLNGGLPIPDGLEEKVLEHWSHTAKGDPIDIQGDHLLEVAFDNRTGELATLGLSIAKLQGQDWQQLLQNPLVMTAIPIIVAIQDIRLDADLVTDDEMSINLRIDGDQAAFSLESFLNRGIQMYLIPQAQQAGLTFQGETKWMPEQKAIIGKFKLTGIEKVVQAKLTGTATPPASTAPARASAAMPQAPAAPAGTAK